MKKQCPIIDDTEGVTLTSLGGVFIVTAMGLLFAASVLTFEVWARRGAAASSRVNVSTSSGVVNQKSGWIDKGEYEGNKGTCSLGFTLE